MRGEERARRSRRIRIRRRVGILLIAGIALTAFLYYRPVQAYMRTSTLSGRAESRGSAAEARPRATCSAGSRSTRAERRSCAKRAGSVSSGPTRSSTSSRASRRGAGRGTRRTTARNSAVNAEDRAVLERQLGRPPRAARRVVVRCPWGAPAVTEQSPYDDAGTPFPTTFYLTCPALVSAVSAAGGGRTASSAGALSPPRTPSSRRASTRRRKSSAQLGASSPTGRSARTAEPRSRSGSAARRARASSSASTRTWRSRSRGRGTCSGAGSSRSWASSFPTTTAASTDLYHPRGERPGQRRPAAVGRGVPRRVVGASRRDRPARLSSRWRR